MTVHRYMWQIKPEASQHMNQEFHNEFTKILDENKGRNLPAPLIFPPVIHFQVEESAVEKLKTLEPFKDLLRVMADEAVDDE
ncbi:hypothetical protein BJ508DRAFT_415105 [Ascobolus immersus RN42]|uniref:Uncharacterized protein n=1 Tax=Ascobolus immersus RN42 TaxID=1160509 RepID=A0A3N4IGP6_ASCIM|nr:hypothetical protein BJ508DRAFT_415105 [Ascobolus immersus RN42]